MTLLTQPGVGSFGWGDALNANWLIVQDMLNGCLVNPIINGGFDYFQRQLPGIYTTIADNKYGPDRWKITRQTADVQTARFDGSGVVGLNAKNYAGFKQTTAAGKIFVCQWIENIDTLPRLGKTVTFQVKMKSTASQTINIAVLELQSAATADTIPSPLVTAWGANGINPTLAANVAIVGTAFACAVTNNFTLFQCAVSVPANSKNLAVALWSDSQFAIGSELYVAEAGLYNGSIKETPNWYPRQIQQEISLCQRFFQKTFPLDTPPAAGAGSPGNLRGTSTNAGIGAFCCLWRFAVSMRAPPSAITYNPITAAATGFYRTDTGVNIGATIADASADSLNVYNSVLTVSGVFHIIHLSAEAEL